MELHTFFHELCTMELADLNFGDESASESPTLETRHRLTPMLNSCLRQIYIDFPVETKELVLRTSASIRRYYLRKEHSIQDPTPVDKYIIDSLANPFLGDIGRIDEVLDEHGKLVFSAHQNVVGGNVRKLTWDSLSFWEPRDNKEYLVRYRVAAPTFTDTDSEENSGVMLRLPPGFVDLLRNMIADRIYSSQKNSDSIAKGQIHKAEAQAIAASLVQEGTAGEEGWNFDRLLRLRGFL